MTFLFNKLFEKGQRTDHSYAVKTAISIFRNTRSFFVITTIEKERLLT